jgi:choline dehydrogenase-like flavoprotein
VKELYDVVVVGSGASGGTMAAHLARAGITVLVLEGGPKIDTRTDFNTHGLPFQFPQRQVPTMRPGKAGFDSPRSYGVGGKTLLWNAVALRMSQRDFKGASREGAGADWPIGYEDMAAYYSKIEHEVGLCGHRDGLADLPDGEFLQPAPLKCSDEILKRGAERIGIKLIHVRKATLTQVSSTPPRPPCHFCGNCMAGCDVVAKYNSADVHLYPAAQETGRLDIRPNSIVYELALDEHTSAVKEVRYLDRLSGQRASARGRVVVLGCACDQTIALLLMSKSARFPKGLANNAGQVGKNYIPHVTCTVDGFLKELIGAPAVNDEGFLDHSYIPSFMHDRPRDYPRSFAVQIGFHNRRYAPWAKQIKGIGAAYKRAVRDRYPAYMQLVGFMEMTPNPDSYVDLDPVAKDSYGLATARVHWKLSASDMKRWRDMRKWCTAILEASGAELLDGTHDEPSRNHELGGCRMGNDATASVIDGHCRTHEVSNLYVVDGSAFPSASEKNPTLTIMALSARTADHIVEGLQHGEYS